MLQQTECRSIAVAGMACVFPGAQSPEELWENVLADRYTPEVRQRLAVAMQACAPPRPEEAK